MPNWQTNGPSDGQLAPARFLRLNLRDTLALLDPEAVFPPVEWLPKEDKRSTIRDKIMGDWSDYFEDFPEENPANQNKPGVMLDLQQRVQPRAGETSAEMQRRMFKMRSEAIKRAGAEKTGK